jgi:hypothetical protein
VIVRKGQRLGSILHERVEPGPAPDIQQPSQVAEPAVEVVQLPAPVEQVDPVADIEQLRAQATALGVQVDRRWGAARLRQEIDERKEDSDGDHHGDA